MNCIAPDEIREGDLMAYVEGDASMRVKDHVARCPACTAEVQALTRANRSLLVNLYRVSCPATETLTQYQTNLLQPDEKRQIADHLKTCPHCMAELRKIAGADLPASGVWQWPSSIVRAVIEAVLVPLRPELAMAARGGEPRQRLYRADDLEIIVGIGPVAPSRGSWRVRGRVTHQGQAASEAITQPAYLVRQEQVVSSDIVDELGYFAFNDIIPGEYDLWFEGPEADIVVHGLEIRSDVA